MSKNSSTSFESMERIDKEIKKLNKMKAQSRIPCSHTGKSGKIKVEFTNEFGLCQCRRCGTKFNFTIIPEDDLDKAITIIHNALNQIKATTSDPDEDKKIITMLGTLDFNLGEVKELYNRTMRDKGKKNKNKKNRDNRADDFGSYGYGGIDFIGMGKKR